MDLQSFIDYCNRQVAGDEQGKVQTFVEKFTALGYNDGIRSQWKF